MNDTISIITLSPSRWREYKTLRINAIMQEPLAFNRTYTEEAEISDSVWKQQLKEAQEGKNYYLFFAEHAGILVGMIAAHTTQGKITKHQVTVSSLYAHGEARKQGIAQKLLEKLIEKLENDDQVIAAQLLINEHQKENLKVYQAAGFTSVGIIKKAFCFDETYHDGLLLGKSLLKEKQKKAQPEKSPPPEVEEEILSEVTAQAQQPEVGDTTP